MARDGLRTVSSVLERVVYLEGEVDSDLQAVSLMCPFEGDIAMGARTFMTVHEGGVFVVPQIMAAARVDAVRGGGKKVNIQTAKSEGGRPRLTVSFTGNRKQWEEELPLYDREEVIQVFQKIMKKQSTSRR